MNSKKGKKRRKKSGGKKDNNNTLTNEYKAQHTHNNDDTNNHDPYFHYQHTNTSLQVHPKYTTNIQIHYFETTFKPTVSKVHRDPIACAQVKVPPF